jgi:hypothetical protein
MFKENKMPGKCIFLTFIFFISFFHFSECSVECYVDGITSKEKCDFNPSDVDGPDLSKCPKEKCKHGCGRSWDGKLVSGPKDSSLRRKRQFPNTGDIKNMLSTITLGCVKKDAKGVDCKKLKDSKEKGLCVCNKPLCNSASKVLPVTVILSSLWIFALI